MNTVKSRLSAISIIVAALLFFSIIPYAGADAWTEAAILAVIFLLAGVAFYRENFIAGREIRQLLAPVLILSLYSFAQFFFTILILNGQLSFSPALPYSYDLAASFWCALKFLAFAFFIKIFLDELVKNYRFLIWSLVVTGGVFAVLGIFRFFLQDVFPDSFGWFILPALRPGVGFGTFVNQNHFAFLMLLNLGLNAGLCAFANTEKTIRLMLFAFSLLTWTAIILTASRGGIISSFAVIALIIILNFAGFAQNESDFPNRKNSRKNFFSGIKPSVIFAFAVVMIAGIFLIGQERLMQRFGEIPAQLESAADTAGFSRLDVWRAAVSMIGEHTFFGVGFGGFRCAVSQYIEISGAVVPEQAHNDYLELAASGGVIAVLCGLWFLYKLISIARKRFSVSANRFETAARIGAVAAFAGIAVHSLFDFGLQFIANWLFLAALAGIAVYEKKSGANGATPTQSAKEKFLFRKLFLTGLCVCSSVVCLLFGYSRLENSKARENKNSSLAEKKFTYVFFDADRYAAKAFVFEQTGNFAASSENLETAVFYRPKDHALHLRLGKIRFLQGRTEPAENAFRQAVNLAPHYGEPHYYYGKFLVAEQRKTEGFSELRAAFQRDPQYFSEVFALARRESGENISDAIGLLSPLDEPKTEKLAGILYEQNEYAALARFGCGDEGLSGGKRDEFITKLFEKRMYIYAFQIHARDCEMQNRDLGKISDGGFENGELREGFGFGWRVRDLPDAVKISYEKDNPASGSRSLRFDFNGNFEPLSPLVSQTLIAEKNRQYVFSYAYRAEKITTGGVPVLQLIFKRPNADVVYKEIKLSGEENVWNKNSSAIQTGSQTEVLEIRLTRQSCNQSLCPIYGRLQLDDFALK